MWKSPLDDREVFVSCPKCETRTQVTIAALRTAERVDCKCGATFAAGSGKLDATIQSVDKAIDDLRKALATVKRQKRIIE
jgi:hypothetical protein